MILWVDGAGDVARHMRRDRALLAAFERGDVREAVLRLFRFEPAGITLGHGQDPARELDLERCRARGIAWATRPTGGRAILHREEWTYALAARIDDPEWGGGLDRAYARASEWIAAALRALGVPCALGASRASDAGPRARGEAAAPCFASTARHEIVVEGRKLVGSAQRRGARALLQQGSVLLGDGHLDLADLLALAPGRREAARRALAAAATTAAPWIASDAPLERFAEALAATGTCRRASGDALELARAVAADAGG